jgi:N6-L-threonylcarbamoyladenine synthase
MATVLGIESTAHTFSVAIVSNGKTLSNIRRPYTTEKGGIIPSEAAKYHDKNKEDVYFEAIKKAKIDEKNIDAIAFSQGPGLTPSLLVGIKFAKHLSSKLGKPLIPVNHCVAHLEIGRTTGAKDPVMLYASGANTQVIAYSSRKFRVFGETLDMGIGNFIDTFARHTGKGFPGGPIIEKLALEGKNFLELPYRVKGMDISLSGILTNLNQKFDAGVPIEDLSYTLQETVFAMLVEVSERALAHTGKKELLLGGGVACNQRLQEMCKIMCKERGAKFFCPEKQFLVDNAGMIAFLGEIIYKSVKLKHSSKTARKKTVNKKSQVKLFKLIYYPNELNELDVKPRQRTDDIEVSWR